MTTSPEVMKKSPKSWVESPLSYFSGMTLALLLFTATSPVEWEDGQISTPSKYYNAPTMTDSKEPVYNISKDEFISKYPYIHLLLLDKVPESPTLDSIVYQVFTAIQEWIAFDRRLMIELEDEVSYRREKGYADSTVISDRIQQLSIFLQKWENIRDTLVNGVWGHLNFKTKTIDECFWEIDRAISEYEAFYQQEKENTKALRAQILAIRASDAYTRNDLANWAWDREAKLHSISDYTSPIQNFVY